MLGLLSPQQKEVYREQLEQLEKLDAKHAAVSQIGLKTYATGVQLVYAAFIYWFMRP